eukprot:TRINITY_DN3397_c0_g1_i1.p1 TRINITY_DN3397_c0_g1~~TRINITY_DN3397_c0_g1_i1.p1  ORF type:complete len:178 (-),score=41.75 TRINITY_DN3397_c0_g1_i1:31-564(-)
MLPLINCADSDKKETEALEKKIKALSNQIDTQAKKDRANFKKATKRGGADTMDRDYQEKMAEHKAKQEYLLDYWRLYREHRLSKWLKMTCAGIDAETDHFKKNSELLNRGGWKSVLGSSPMPLPELPNINGGASEESTPLVWILYKDEKGQPYYVHKETGETRWDNPNLPTHANKED